MKAVILSLVFVLPFPSRCQVAVDPQEMLDQIADQLLATAEEDVSYDELYETLTHLLANPVDLNAVTKEQLRAVMLFSESEINALLTYRNQQGHFLDVLELQAIPGWSDETIRRAIPFVAVPNPNGAAGKGLLQRIARETNQYAVMRYERILEDRPAYQSAGDSSQRYAGNPDRYYIRYRVARPNDFSIGFTAEKDPGEALRWSPASGLYGFDFYSGHIQLLKRGRLENLLVGDFQCQFGQGLQLGSTFGLGKTAQTITGIRRSNLGFLPYASAGESNYLRGLAATLRLAGPLRIHLFGSQKQLDSQVEPGAPSVTSIQTSGLHRTARELSARGKIADRDLGLVLQYRTSAVDIGLIMHLKDRSHDVIPDDTPYNQFQFRGSRYSNAGGYINYSTGSVTFFAEYAQTAGHGRGMTAGLLGNLTHKLEMAWLYRDFSPDYYSDYANAVTEGSAPQNEQGLYWGMKYSFNRRVALQGYLDYFRFPWLRYRVYRPSDGREWLLRLDYSPRRGVTFFVQAREEVKSRNLPGNGNLYVTAEGSRMNAWVSGEFLVTPGFSLKSRFQGSQYELGDRTTRGMAIVQEVTVKKTRWSFSIRYALFDTDDYENRQYVYEKNVWLATSLPAYEGSGVRNYVLVHYSASRHLDIWLRWARTVYADRASIGSGMERIAGNARNDINFQVRIRL